MIPLVPKDEHRRFLEEATEQYHNQLLDDEEALSYLQARGITSEAQSLFFLGIVRKPLEGHESYQNRIAFPYLTPSGITTIRFRILGTPFDKQKKFLSLPGDQVRLYNVQSIIGEKNVYICEGETDTIAACLTGISAVGVPGAQAWHKDSRVFSRVFANRSVTVLADNDDSGEGMDFAKEIYQTLGGCRIVLMPRGHDVSSFLQEEGEDVFKKYIKSG